MNAGDALTMPGVRGSPNFGVVVAVNEKAGYAFVLLQNQHFIFVDYETARQGAELVKTYEVFVR